MYVYEYIGVYMYVYTFIDVVAIPKGAFGSPSPEASKLTYYMFICTVCHKSEYTPHISEDI